jgi:nucleoside phosphorylase
VLNHPTDPIRNPGVPRVHHSPIASSGTLLKNPKRRDQLGAQFGVKAVEMEGAGIAEAAWAGGRGYLVIRGGCDYCDTHKNDDWQRYAAVVAAAYLKALLSQLPVA